MITDNTKINPTSKFLQSSNLIVFGALLGLKIATGTLFTVLGKKFAISTGNNFVFSFWQEIALALIVAPLFETLIAAFIPIELTLRLLRTSRYKTPVAIAISSIIFSLNHPYSFFYLMATLVSGLIYSSTYVLAKSKQLNPFVITCVVHSAYNLFALTMDKILSASG